MRAASLFSGVGAPEIAMPGWQWLWHAEIDPFASAVMATRHPGSINLGDVTADDFVERALRVGRPDVVVFGSPCQSFSIAGKRGGMADARGNLALVGLEVVSRIGSPWLVFENVPGLLSNWTGEADSTDHAAGDEWEAQEDSDFAAFLGEVRERGYLGCWRVLDAQYAGVAQRRDRLFFVGRIGDWRPAAEVLFEPASLRGHPAPSREAGEDVASTVETRAGRRFDHDPTGSLIARPVLAGGHANNPLDETLVPTFLHVNKGRPAGRKSAHTEMVTAKDHVPALTTDGLAQSAVAYRTSPNCGAWETGDRVDALTTGTDRGSHLVAFNNTGQGWWNQSATASPIRDMSASSGSKEATLVGVAVAMNLRGREGGAMPELDDLASVRSASGGSSRSYVAAATVRRLTPLECERLQGLPENWTLIDYRGKPAADGPRYRVIGNSMAVPVIAWILRRLDRVAARIAKVA